MANYISKASKIITGDIYSREKSLGAGVPRSVFIPLIKGEMNFQGRLFQRVCAGFPCMTLRLFKA